MGRLLACSLGIPIVGVLAATSSASLAADIEWNRLNACGDIASVFQQLRNGSKSDDDCRQPNNAVERGIANAFAPSGQKTCFLRRSPLPALSDFGCLRTSAGGHEGITCMRPTRMSVVANYRDGYKDTYAGVVNNYLRQAAACPGTNGDADKAPPTTFSPFLLSVAAYELSFVAQYGKSRPGNAAAYHGFARTSPDASRTGIEAIEFVTYNWNSDNSALDSALNYTRHGNWRIRTDDGSEFTSELTKAARKKGLALTAGVFDVRVMRSVDAPSLSSSDSVSDKLAKKAITNLEDEGFEAMPESDLRANTGMDSTEMMEKVAKQMPYGSQSLAARFMSNPRVTILMRTSGPSCTSGSRGAFGAYVLRNDGDKDAKADHGSVSVFVLGFGACGRSIEANNSYIRSLVSDAKDAVLAELKSR